MSVLLQVADTSAAINGLNTVQQAAEGFNLLSLLEKGGWLMYPLYLLFVATIFVFFERLIAIRKASKIDNNFMNIIRDNIVTGNLVAARNLAKNTDNPPASIAGGIYTKMVTSASGLIIGLLAYVAYNFLNTQINKTVNKMEAASAEFVDILQEPTR